MIVLSALGLLAAVAAVQAGAQSPSTAPPATAKPADGDSTPARRLRVDTDPGEAGGWWNRKVGDDLALSSDQKRQMDERAKAFAGKQRIAVENTQEHRDALRKALEAGNWDEARRLYRKQSEEAAGLVQAQGEFQIALLSLLTGEQRRKLAATHGNLLTAPGRGRPTRSGAEAPESR